jgi:uncharacterized protein (TIGR03083 family)
MSRRSVLIESLEATPRDLARLLRPLSEEQARQSPASGGWSAATIVAHLAYGEERFLARLRRVVAEDNPAVEYIGGPASYDVSPPLSELLAGFAERRAATVAFLRGLEQRDWARPLVHPTMGPSRLRDQVQLFVDHDSEHLAEIVRLREEFGA